VKHSEILNVAYRERVGVAGDINTMVQANNKVKLLRQGKYRGDTKVFLEKKGNVEVYVETKPNQFNPDMVNYRVSTKGPAGKTRVIERGTADADAYYHSLKEATYGKGTHTREYVQYLDENLNIGVGQVKIKGALKDKPVRTITLVDRKLAILKKGQTQYIKAVEIPKSANMFKTGTPNPRVTNIIKPTKSSGSGSKIIPKSSGSGSKIIQGGEIKLPEGTIQLLKPKLKTKTKTQSQIQIPAINTANVGRIGKTGIKNNAFTKRSGRISQSSQKTSLGFVNRSKRISMSAFGLATKTRQKQKTISKTKQKQIQKGKQKSAQSVFQILSVGSTQRNKQISKQSIDNVFGPSQGTTQTVVPVTAMTFPGRIFRPTPTPSTKKAKTKKPQGDFSLPELDINLGNMAKSKTATGSVKRKFRSVFDLI